MDNMMRVRASSGRIRQLARAKKMHVGGVV